MDALAEDKDIQLLASSPRRNRCLKVVMEAKFGGSTGVAVGPGGPGATHLLTVFTWDAAMDNTPFLLSLITSS